MRERDLRAILRYASRSLTKQMGCPVIAYGISYGHGSGMERLLVIDDDRELCELLTDYLDREGFEVVAVHDGSSGIRQAVAGAYALVVLDVMLPDLNGFEVLKHIRSGSTIPVLMLTARGDEIDRIVGLELGADDYLAKPFNPRELVARIRAVQRRTMARDQPGPGQTSIPCDLKVGDVELRPGTHTILLCEDKVEMTAMEFSILHELLKNAGQVMTREALAEKILGRKLALFDRSIDVHISSIRKKIGSYPGGQERILSIRGVGYQYLYPEKATSSNE